MGYSISVPLKSVAARDRMLAFLLVHYRSWTKVQAIAKNMAHDSKELVEEEYDWTHYILVGKELAYDDGVTKIGFNCGNSGGPCGNYAWSILRWIALRLGRKKSFKQLETTQLVPYVIYDGSDCWPVLERSIWEDRVPKAFQWTLNDNGYKITAERSLYLKSLESRQGLARTGFKMLINTLDPGREKSWDFQENTCKLELQRLSKLWEENNKI